MSRQRNTSLIVATAALMALTVGVGAQRPGAERRRVRTHTGRSIPGQYIVVFKPAETGGPANSVEAASDDLVRSHGGQRRHVYERALRGFSARLTAAAADALANDSRVDYVIEDAEVRAADDDVNIAGTQSGATWGLDRIDQRDLPTDSIYNYGAAGAGVHAYVIDSGLRSTQTEFSGRIGDGIDEIGDGHGLEDCEVNGHGTHVAGTLGGTTYGVAKLVTIHPVRVLGCNGSGAVSGIIAGIDWVTIHHINPAVANVSIEVTGTTSDPLDSAIVSSINSGVVYAVAAGNDGVDACQRSPGRVAAALSVGATDSTDTRASFSNFGSCVDLFAPGVNVVSASNLVDTGNRTLSGTSMATPHVAGVAALYLSQFGNVLPSVTSAALIDWAAKGRVIGAGAGSPNRMVQSIFDASLSTIRGAVRDTTTNAAIGGATITLSPGGAWTQTAGDGSYVLRVPAGSYTGVSGSSICGSQSLPVSVDLAGSTTQSFSPTCTPTELIVNGSFAAGTTGWTRSGSMFADSQFGGCRSCPGNAYLAKADGTAGNSLTGAIGQLVTLPPNTASAWLTFYYSITTQETLAVARDTLSVTVQSATGATLSTVAGLSNLDKTIGYVQRAADLSAFAGQTIKVNFQASNDGNLPTLFRLDDVSLLISPSATRPVVTTGTATLTTVSSATVSATANANGTSATLYFDYGLTNSYGSTAVAGDIGAGTTPLAVPFTINGLACGAVYNYRARAQNVGGTSYGANQLFATSACPPPAIGLSTAVMSFTATQGGGAPGQPLTVSNSGGGILNWSASQSASWLQVSASSGTAPSPLAVSVNTTGLSPNMYTATLTIAAPGASNSPRTVLVTLVITPAVPPTLTVVLDQVIDEDASTGALAITVDDLDSPLETLTLSGTSSNTALVPNDHIIFAGSGASRTVQLVPAADQSGATTITVTVSDGVLTSSRSFGLTVNPVNDPPALAAIGDLSIEEDHAIGVIGLTVNDIDTPVDSLTLSATSSNTGLVPNDSIKFSGTGAHRNLVVGTASNANGSATITVIVSDGALTASRSFLLTVTPVNDAPTISSIAAQSTIEGAASAIAFTVGDVDNDAGGLTVSAASSNSTLVPNGSISFGGGGANRLMTIAPAPNQHGTATITVTVSDGSLSASTSFAFTVLIAAPLVPTITVADIMLVCDGNPHPATATATGSDGSPVAGSFAFAYSPGGAAAPVKPGTYAVSATFTSSDPRYLNASGAGVITIIPATSAPGMSSRIYELVAARAKADSGFVVYRDQDSGFNHGFPSGLFASQGNLPTIHVDTGCVNDDAAAGGCSIDPAVVDRTRGTVLRITFDPQPSGAFAGLNVEEPENWGVSPGGVGYDLSGATSLMLDARAPGGAQVKFGVGGCTTGFMTVATTWTPLTIPLDSLSCTPDLSNVHLLFSVSTNDGHAAAGATVLLDNVRFNPAPATRTSTLAFPVSTDTFGVVPRTSAPIPSDQALRNVASIYESALSELVLLRRGTTQDLVSARRIADAFDYALHHEASGDALPISADGAAGLHNAYEAGDLAAANDQAPPKIGRAGDSRIAGFTDPTLCPGSGFCLMLDGATGGNNAFAILALLAAYDQYGDARYMDDASTIAGWILGTLRDGSGTGYGGYFAGYPDAGVPPPKPLLKGKSVENNADIFAALTALAVAETRAGHVAAASMWTAAANVAGDFVAQLFDQTAGRFYGGTVPIGTAPGPGICPDGPTLGDDVVNTCDFLDATTFPILAMAGSPRYRDQLDWRRPMQYVIDHFAQTISVNSRIFQGFNIVPLPVSGAKGIGWEFTAQMIEAMRYVDRLYAESQFEGLADFYLAQLSEAQGAAPFADGLGLVASTLQNGDTAPLIAQCVQTPFQCIPERVGLAASTWALFAEQQWNVLGTPVSGTPSMTVRSPNTATAWRVGDVRNLNFLHTLGIGQPVTISISRDSGVTWSPITTLSTISATTGSYTWTVVGPATAQARIRVAWTVDPSISDISDVDFTIAESFVTVRAPNRAVKWRVGDTQPITFVHNLGSGQLVDLEVSADGGASWSPIGTVPTASSTITYPWVVTGPPTSRARIRASWRADPSVTDTSDVDFAIVPSAIVLSSPNTAVTWRIGETHPIVFTHNLGAGQLIAIDVSRDGGDSWIPLTTFVTTGAAVESYPWVVTGPPTSQVRVQLTWSRDATVTAFSDVDFIIPAPVVTVTAPNTTVSWRLGSAQTIVFTGNLGTGQPVAIDVSRDSGATWTPITMFSTTSASSGRYVWIVDGAPTTHARVRVTWSGDGTVTDMSDVDFTIAAPIVTVRTPNTAVAWDIGTVQSITWTHNLGVAETVNIDVSWDGGATWAPIAAGVSNTAGSSGSYDWIVSGPPTAAGRIRVSWTGGPASDISDKNFTIR